MQIRLRKSKKGYIFIIDAIFAAIILSIGFMIISSSHKISDETPMPVAADNFLDVLSRVTIDDLCEVSTCVCTNRKLQETCILTNNTQQTLLDHMGELYELGKEDLSRQLFSNFTYLIRKDLYGVSFSIGDDEIYSDSGKDTSKVLIAKKKIIFGFIENPRTGEVIYWGPYMAEVDFWEK